MQFRTVPSTRAILLFRLADGAALILRIDGFIWRSLSSPSGKSVDWCGAKANREQLAIGHPAYEMEIIIPHETNQFALLVPYHLIQHYFGEELLAHALTSRFHHLKCNPQHGGNLFSRLDRMVSKYQANSAFLTDALKCKAVELQLMDDLADYLDNFYTKAHRPPSSQRRKLLHRAINFGESLRETITIPEFAMASGLSPRSLQLAFQETLGLH